MKKLVCLFLILSITLSCRCDRKGINKVSIEPLSRGRQALNISYDEASCRPALKPYSIKQDLSNILNTALLPELNTLDRYALSKNIFFIKKPDMIFEQPFNLYEKNGEDGIPNFITSDSVLHVYHLMNDYVIKAIEKERLVGELKTFTEIAFRKSIEIYREIDEASAKKAALKNIAYFGIAMRLQNSDLPGGIPMEANRIIDNDVKKVKSRWSSGTSEIFPYYTDYKGYIAKGHYYRETEFRNYLLTMMWYGSAPIFFELYDASTCTYQRLDEQVAMTVIMASSILEDETLRKLWDDIYNVSAMYAGKAEDITIYDLYDIIKVVYGERIDFNKIWDEGRIRMVYELAKQRYNLHAGETIAGRINRSNSDYKAQTRFALMGYMYNLDTHLYDNLLAVRGPQDGEKIEFSRGLNIPAAFGSDKAQSILVGQADEIRDWAGYNEALNRLKAILGGANGDNPNEYSINNSLFWVLKGYAVPSETGYPSFMLNENWESKKMLTYVSAVSDTRHPTSITAKKGEVEDKDVKDIVPSDMPGYVEPDLKLYSRLEYMGKYIKGFLSQSDFTDSSVYSCIDNFIDLISFLKGISIKELENKHLTMEEESRLRRYARELKTITLSAVEGKDNTKDWDMVPKVDRNMAVVTDIYQNENQILQSAVGSPDYIYVVVPYNDKLYLTRGSVYTYYEFINPVSRKLDDSDWQSIVKDNKEIEQQEWIQEIRSN